MLVRETSYSAYLIFPAITALLLTLKHTYACMWACAHTSAHFLLCAHLGDSTEIGGLSRKAAFLCFFLVTNWFLLNCRRVVGMVQSISMRQLLIFITLRGKFLEIHCQFLQKNNFLPKVVVFYRFSWKFFTYI